MSCEPEAKRWTGEGFKLFLKELREIGWTNWDPIGLASDRAHCEDEYDSYLLAASGKLANGASEAKVADYLVQVETRHMGLPKSQSAQGRALMTARCIAALFRESTS